MSEMKTLTLNGKTYDSFVDKEAREAIKNIEPGGGTVTDEQIASAVESYMAEHPVIPCATVEPADDDIPKVFFGGALQQTKDEAVVPFRYISKTDDFSGYAEIKAQGNSSMNYPKKNQTVKMFADEACESKMKKDFKGWGKQNKHVYKANWIDLSHARNIVSARLWADVVKSRADYAELPELLRTSPNQGAVDGFPVKVYAAGVYQGRYTLNIPKDKWTFNMDDKLDSHCVLCGENYVSGCFRTAALINESDWTDEIHDVVPASIKTRWNQVISFVMNSTDEDFRSKLNQYFYVDSLIDYYLFGLASCGLDAFGKNQIYATYDGQKWIASMYDMDSTWGLYWNGSKFVSASYGRNEFEDMVQGRQGNLLYIRLEELFWPELQTRWAELKNGVLSIDNIINHFERFTDIAPAELVKEDYAPSTGGGKFTGIPSQSTNNIQQIRAFALARQAWTDEYVAALTPKIPVPCDGISLDKTELTFTGEGTQTVTATVIPDGCTDDVVWVSSNPEIAVISVSGYVCTVGAIANGSTTITATCGEYSASCSVAVSGISEGNLMYSLAEETTFDGTRGIIDTGIPLFDKDRSFTIFLDYTTGVQKVNQAHVFHGVKENPPYPGMSLRTFNSLTSNYRLESYASNVIEQFGSANTIGRYKVAIVHTAGTSETKCYVDSTDNAYTMNETVARTNLHSQNITIGGALDNGAEVKKWVGTVHEFKIWYRALSTEEISDIYTDSGIESGGEDDSGSIGKTNILENINWNPGYVMGGVNKGEIMDADADYYTDAFGVSELSHVYAEIITTNGLGLNSSRIVFWTDENASGKSTCVGAVDGTNAHTLIDADVPAGATHARFSFSNTSRNFAGVRVRETSDGELIGELAYP